MRPSNPPERSKEFARLADVDAQLRRQFVEAELSSCRVALEVGEFELSSGATWVAANELAAAEKIVREIRRFLPRTRAEHRAELTDELAHVLALVDGFKGRLDAQQARLGQRGRAR